MNFFRNMKLAQKISLLSISFFIFLLVIGYTSVTQISKVNSQIKELNDSRMAPIIALEGIKSDIEYIRTQGSSLMDSSDTSAQKTAQDNVAARVATLDKKMANYKNDSEFKNVLTNYAAFIKAKDAFLTSAAERAAQQNASAQGTPPKDGGQGGPTDVKNFDSAKTALTDSLDKIINQQVAAANQTYDDSKTVYTKTVIGLLIGLTVAIVLTLVLSIVIIRAITAPVKRVTTKLREISQSNGDLTQRIGYRSKDEIGDLSNSFDMFIDKLHSIIKEFSDSAETMSYSSERLNQATSLTTQSLDGISNTITQIAANTSDGAAAAEETTASLVEAAKFSEATSSASRNTAYNSKKAKDAAEDGAAKISEIVESITDIADSSKEVSIMIGELDDSSKKIGDIIEIITSISEQTNLLALNAAIEAARAGEAGKGFSVVAEEIRKLADESNNAATEISNLVKENQLKSASAVSSVSQVETKVSQGVTKASEVGESIQNIIENIQDIVNQIEQIDNANEQQAQSTKEIEKAINNIAVTSNEVAGSTENISASIQEQLSTMNEIERTTEELSEMARKLKDITSGFTL
ncbi:MAG: methyl-accepting chemotaxis protein [Bacillota bacterium]|nr:methyl-accepting chemotaxis protein [Bacillota bacterium]